MRIIDVEQNTPEWLELRRGRVMGSIAQDVIPKEPLKADVEKALKKLGMEYIQTDEGVPATGAMLKKLLPTEQRVELGRTEGHKVGFYQLVADALSMPADDEDRMDRGHRLEHEAIEELERQIGKKINMDIGICTRDDEERIANSPDGMRKERGKWVIAVEVKCLKSALHIQAVVENKIPDEYWSQAMQYFVVNDDLEILYFVFYDPRFAHKPLHVIELKRENVQETVEHLLAYQIDALKQVDELVERLSF